MRPTDDSVDDFIDRIGHEKRKRDSRVLVDLMRESTGEEPRMWGSIVGFGEYHYRYASGTEGDAPAAGFAPRKSAMTVYLNDGVDAHTDSLEQLGPHTTGVGCLYIKDLEEVDLAKLRQIVATSYQALSAGTYTQRASEDPDQA